jgi:hypothetical protein
MSAMEPAILTRGARKELERLSASRHALAAALILGVLHALLYVLLVPPWQHYDEPHHFEYAWLMANKPGIPTRADRDPVFERRLVESMAVHDFYRGMQAPDLSPEGAVRLGLYDQFEERPYYYLLVSLPLRLMQGASLEDQLYAGRLVSALFLLLTIVAAWGTARELSPPGGLLRWALPLTVALLPGFVDIMTAVNNDAAAVGLFSLFVWGAAYVVRRGLTSWRSVLVLGGAALAAAAAALVKSTAVLALPLLGLAVILALARERWRGPVGVAFVLAMAALPLFLLAPGDPFDWHRSTLQTAAARLKTEQAPLGKYAFMIQPGQGTTPTWNPALFQAVPREQVEVLQGKTATLGWWAWADEPIEVQSPALWVNGVEHSILMSLAAEPRFFTLTADIPADAWRVWITLDPGKNGGSVDRVFFDGLILAADSFSSSQAPVFADEDGRAGEWGGKPFSNLARNASAEHISLRFQPWAEHLGARLLPDGAHPSLLLTAPLDLPGNGWYYRTNSLYLGRTWWGMFGWGHVPLLGDKPYRWVGLVSGVAVLGFGVSLWRDRKRAPWALLIFLGLTLLGVWGAALLRGSAYLGYERLLWSPARYAAPAMIPAALILTIGMLQVLSWIPIFRYNPARRLEMYSLLLAVLGVVAIFSILIFYAKV